MDQIVEQPPHERLVASINKPANLRSFYRQYFAFVYDTKYINESLKLMDSHPTWKSGNPALPKLYARTLLTAAELQLPQVTGHKVRHEKHQYSRSYVDPYHIISLQILLSKLVMDSNEKQSKIIDHWRQTRTYTPEKDFLLQTAFFRPKGEVMLIPDPQEIGEAAIDLSLLGDRSASGLPLLRPDLEFHSQMAQVAFDGRTADTIGDEEFAARILPLLRAIYARQGLIDLDTIFQRQEAVISSRAA